MNAQSVLKKYFGYGNFREGQEEIIDTILQGKDCLVLMPTGGGKSLCFQVPALLLKGVTVVISPLISLMKDQVDALRLNGISAAFLNSSQSPGEQEMVFEQINAGTLRLLYIAPERLSGSGTSFLDYLRDKNVSLFAIDEAHCISQWGHDFRPDYLTLSRLKRQFPSVPLAALTATADKLTRKDIIDKLKLVHPEIFISSFNRPNIRYTIDEKNGHFEKLTAYLSGHRGDSGIIYCLSRKNTETLAEKLTEQDFPALAYHAGLEAETRRSRQDQFKNDEVKIIVATIAFGMGIDKSNVRYVIHQSMPKNIEGYYQETGRAGRDGLPSDAILFYSPGDLLRLRSFAAVEGNEEQSRIMLRKLQQMGDFCESHQCRRKFLLNYFDEDFSGNCGNCDVCLGRKQVESFDGTIIAQKALSAVTRLKERFGMHYLIGFLKGSDSQKIWDEHKYLPTFGKGKEHSTEEWRSYFKELADQGFLIQSEGEYSVLKLTPKAREVLYDGKTVMLHVVPTKKEIKTERKKKVTEENKEAANYDKVLFEELRVLRTSIAAREKVPAYIVFPDSTLAELARHMPQSPSELRNISGFGQVKLRKYGATFLEAVKGYVKRKEAGEGG